MFKKIFVADIWVLENIATPISLRIEYYTGLNNYNQARWVLILYLIGGLISSIVSTDGVWRMVISFIVSLILLIRTYIEELINKPNQYPMARTDPFQRFVRTMGYLLITFMTMSLIYQTYNYIQPGYTEYLADNLKELDTFVKTRVSIWAGYITGISSLLYSYFLARDPKPPEPRQQEVLQTTQ